MKSFKEYTGIKTPPVSLEESVKPDGVSVKMGSTHYNLEVADTPNKIIEGLSYRENIPQKTGMLFVMPKEQIHEFWMKDCLTDMDIIFLTTEGQIVNMENMIKERHKVSFETNESYQSRLKMYSSKYPAKYAIEIPSGDISRLGLEVGQYININNEIEEQATAPPLARMNIGPHTNTRSSRPVVKEPTPEQLAAGERPKGRQNALETSTPYEDMMQFLHTGQFTAKTLASRKNQEALDAGVRPEFKSNSSPVQDTSILAAEFGAVDKAVGMKRTGPGFTQSLGLSRNRTMIGKAWPIAAGVLAGELVRDIVTEPALDALDPLIDKSVQYKMDSDFEERKKEPWYQEVLKSKARRDKIDSDRAELIKSDLDSYRPQFP